VYSVNWVGALCNVGLGFFVEWGGGGEGTAYAAYVKKL
jgi:hypothetical protein